MPLARLDELLALGVDAIWLSPVVRSRMKDFGYDMDLDGAMSLTGLPRTAWVAR